MPGRLAPPSPQSLRTEGGPPGGTSRWGRSSLWQPESQGLEEQRWKNRNHGSAQQKRHSVRTGEGHHRQIMTVSETDEVKGCLLSLRGHLGWGAPVPSDFPFFVVLFFVPCDFSSQALS